MTNNTARQLLNATAAKRGPAVWRVVGKRNSADHVKPLYIGLTYREAVALARAVREGFGWADVERAVKAA